MTSGSSRSSLVKLMILILLTQYSMVLSAPIHGQHHRAIRKISLSDEWNMTKTKFLCKEPQSRSYNLKHLMQNVLKDSTEIAKLPIYIVLKRCDRFSGCCAHPDMSCSPVASAIYYEDIEIKINDLLRGDSLRWIRVEQHGLCTCYETTMIDDLYQMKHQQPNVTLI